MHNESSSIDKALAGYGLAGSSVESIASKDGIAVARVRCGFGSAILKCFEKPEYRRELENYKLLQSCGVPTLAVLGMGEDSILLEDIAASPRLRLGVREDLDDPKVVRAVAEWYRLLHKNGGAYVLAHGEGIYDEQDGFTLENIIAIRERFGLEASRGLNALEENFDLLKKLLDEAPRTLTYNDFYYTNLAVARDNSFALMFDYDLLGKGIAASDLENVTYWFTPENKREFFDVYGHADERYITLNRLTSPVISLDSAMRRGIFPEWAKEAIDALETVPELLKKLSF